MSSTAQAPREWIIQKCIDAGKNHYEDWWPPHEAPLLTRSEMLYALQECEQLWRDHECRGHKVKP
jgi:hypothetical protein